MAKNKKKAEGLAARLAKLAPATTGVVHGPGPTRSIVRLNKDQRLVAVMCSYEDCGEQFPLKKKGDISSYNLAGYDRHLAEVHGFTRPRPVEVWGF